MLGLLKRVLAERQDFKVIVSSATMNTELFSAYFDNCPIVTIDTITYPVSLVYDPPAIAASTSSPAAAEALLAKIEATTDRCLANGQDGDILIFLPGERIIKDCIARLESTPFARKIHLVPLYGRLGKEEQERVFDSAPFGKKKVIVSTNIAETSVTISGVTSVIDSGLAKLNYYNPKTYTSSLLETPVSKASCNQRKGRAGRTQEGTCYRLFERKDFEKRQLYTTEEIYRTDLSEVVLRMAELGITDFEHFDFISPPNREGLLGAIETLNLLEALNPDRTLSKTGQLMVQFPLLPRQSRMIVEAILSFPDIIEEVLIAAAFLSAQSPFLLPPGEETDARRAHHAFRDPSGDFVSYIKLYRTFKSMPHTEKFCRKNYLDERVMAEIVNIKEQLEQIVADMGIPVLGGGSIDEYLCCIAKGMIQFVCVRDGRETYRSLTAEHIQIHPGSNMFRENPQFIVAGEIVRTSRTYAMSVSPLSLSMLKCLAPLLETALVSGRKAGNRKKDREKERPAAGEKIRKGKKAETDKSGDTARISGQYVRDTTNTVCIYGTDFSIQKIKGKKTVILPWERFRAALAGKKSSDCPDPRMEQLKGLRGKILIGDYELLAGEKIDMIIRAAETLDFTILDEKSRPHKKTFTLADGPDGHNGLLDSLDKILRVAVAKQKSKELGFICLFTDGNGAYWFKVSRGFTTALNESLSSLETLIDEAAVALTESQKARINAVYRTLNSFYE